MYATLMEKSDSGSKLWSTIPERLRQITRYSSLEKTNWDTYEDKTRKQQLCGILAKQSKVMDSAHVPVVSENLAEMIAERSQKGHSE